MNLDVVAFILSVISAVAAVLAVPALQPYLQRAPKNIYEPITRYRGRTITIFSVLTVAVLAVYIFFFYPCPWYKANSLQLDALRYFEQKQWTSASRAGEMLCDCGAKSIGWDIQAKSKYAMRDYRGAIDAWNKAIEADPDNGATKRANIADASIWIDDYKTAVERYGALYKGDPENSRYRYGYGRALVFDGDYSNALDILRGVTNDDGGSSGQSRVFEGIARLGLSSTSGVAADKGKHLESAIKNLCSAIQIEPQWREWLFPDTNSDVGHLRVFRDLLATISPLSCT
ncbi:tetratricopeptide repeat protein [Rhizobium brockwellii]|uniref:tetratricopeptide repeat protein n=1 Tax=Rhizobium brockwellii TaxID=3019932 RepID=UPI000522FA49|nr:tetratricopeptide repeat protein [Rhizobium brockwellii]KPN23479.1 hypothetical protein KS05_28165 [Rhizobium brockwellii]QJX09039.1 tetratricopeptide repeat protein [Rhizobium brockwellii]